MLYLRSSRGGLMKPPNMCLAKRANDNPHSHAPKSSSLFSSLTFHHSAFLPQLRHPRYSSISPKPLYKPSHTSPDLPTCISLSPASCRSSSTIVKSQVFNKPLNASELLHLCYHKENCFSAAPTGNTTSNSLESRFHAI